MQLIRVTHANLKRPVYFAKSQYFAHYFSPGHQCTHILSTGGAIIPAQESEEAITRLLGALTTIPMEGDKNEQSATAT